MKKISLLIFIFTLGFTSFAEELKFLTGGKYVNGECRNGKYVNDQCVRKKRIWGKWVTQKYYNKILRPLKEFKVGKKYCLYGTRNWDEACQDAAFEYAFGENWREFKRVALEFIEGVKSQDEQRLEKLFSIPSGVFISSVVNNDDGSIGYRPHDAKNSDELSYLINAWILNLEKYLNNVNYMDLIIQDSSESGGYEVMIANKINFSFYTNCERNKKHEECFYEPKITVVMY